MSRKKKTNEVPPERITALAEKIENAVSQKEKAIEPVRQKISADIVSSLVLNGDVGKMSESQKVEYYNGLCSALGLNPLTRPFQLIKLNGKEVLYAAKDATDQLRKLNGVSVIESSQAIINDICTVTVKVSDKSGRTDCEIGAVNVKGLTGDALANALMKANTKAKRRATLSICGLGALDETELETIPAMKNVTPTVTHTEESPQSHHDEPSQEIKDPLVYNMMQGTTGYGQKWNSLPTDVITNAHKFYSDEYKGPDGEALSAILADILEERRLNVDYDPKTNRYKA